MIKTFNQTFSYKLDKAHLQECFEQSAPPVQTKDYYKAFIFVGIAIPLFFVESEHYYFPFFLFCRFVLELLGIKYRQTWWVWRQLMGKSGNGMVEVIIHDKGITTRSKHVNTELFWSDVNSIEETDKGILIKHKAGTNYLSKNHLNKESIAFVLQQVAI